ncbi:hypothetical protein SDC9_108606 [bioreactor metagenome]|uniref:Uncharacterized protein n=1 Tax=bioreactor metagenome TaxID=1076179 RepID=A0A645B9M5_9ZZZZ
MVTAEESVYEVDQRLQKFPLQHQLSRQYEERHGEEGKAVHSLVHLLRDDDDRIIAHKHVYEGTYNEVIGYGQAYNHQA